MIDGSTKNIEILGSLKTHVASGKWHVIDSYIHSRPEFINILGRWQSLNTMMNDDPGHRGLAQILMKGALSSEPLIVLLSNKGASILISGIHQWTTQGSGIRSYIESYLLPLLSPPPDSVGCQLSARQIPVGSFILPISIKTQIYSTKSRTILANMVQILVKETVYNFCSQYYNIYISSCSSLAMIL